MPYNKQALLDSFEVVQMPSASFLFDTLVQNPPPRTNRLAVMAPANDLPFSRLEAKALARNPILGAQATEKEFSTIKTDALDIAAHAKLNSNEPLESHLEFAQGQNDDGRLTVAEIFNLEDLPSLVSLSACETARGPIQNAAWLGLGSAFLTSGAQTVVASRHRVSDLAAAITMKRFYRNLKTTTRGEALRKAAILTREYFPHPAHWANFVLMGDYR